MKDRKWKETVTVEEIEEEGAEENQQERRK